MGFLFHKLPSDEWASWGNIHQETDQCKRIVSAKKGDCTPLDIDLEKGTGQFSGSHGVYTTSLAKCSCVDFSRRKKPCKHMYRLALELGLMEGTVAKGAVKRPKPSNAYTLEQAVDRLETLSIEAQRLLLCYFSHTCNQTQKEVALPLSSELKELLDAEFLVAADSPDISLWLQSYSRNELNARIITYAPEKIFKKNLSLSNLCDWIIENIENPAQAICYDTLPVVISPMLYGAQRKLHAYLKYVHETESYYDPEEDAFIDVPAGSTDSYSIRFGQIVTVCEDEQVARLLEKYHS